MSFQKDFESEIKKFERDAALFGKEMLGNDLTFFDRDLKDARLQLAFSLGWMLEKTSYQGVDYYSLVPPPHYECNVNMWCAVHEYKDIDGVKISFPDWYYENEVFMTGGRRH